MLVADSVRIDPPEPELTSAVILERARALRPALRERQALCEELGRLPDETNDDFLRAGFYRMLQPRVFGGYEFPVVDFIRVMTEVSRGCSESGWVLALTSGHPAAFLSGFPEQAQREVYGVTGDVRVPGVALPGGMAMPTDEGYRISGSWDYASGCDVATHFLGAVIILDAVTRQPAAYGYVLLDPPMYTIVDNWSVIGMQGTGSKRIVAAEQIVAAHRVQPFADPTMSVVADQPGRKLHTNPLFHGPLVPLLLTELASVAVGTARGALDVYDEMLRTKKSPLPPFLPAFEATHYLGQRALAGTPAGLEEQRRYQAVVQNILELTWQAVDLIFRTGGASAARRGSLIGRAYKNLAVIRTHITMQGHVTSLNVGRLHFGLSPLSIL